MSTTVLEDAVARAYNFAVALAINRALLGGTTPGLLHEGLASDIITAKNTGTYVTLVISQGFALASEVLLGLTIVAAIYGLVACLVRKSLLRQDPDSVAALIALIYAHFRSPKTLEFWNTELETATASQLAWKVESFICKPSSEGIWSSFKICVTAERQNKEFRKLPSEKYLHQTLFGLATFYRLLFVGAVGCALLLRIAY